MFARPGDAPARLGVSLSTLDDRNAIRPTVHIWVSEKLDWLTLDDDQPQYQEGFDA